MPPRPPSPAELALDACLATGMPADVAARFAELASVGTMSKADQERMTRRLKKLLELAKSWQAFAVGEESGRVATVLLGAAAVVVRQSPMVAGGEELFVLLARAIWRQLEE